MADLSAIGLVRPHDGGVVRLNHGGGSACGAAGSFIIYNGS
ncbi:MAG TPA: hypothetical protein VMW89_03355 [Desulfatiglandales bacterium]|nr:hypothetical protein [Desulfatiglandales bacterium]